MTGRRGDTAKALPATHNYTHRWRCIDCHPEDDGLREALRALSETCDCPPDWLMQDGSHDRECIQHDPVVRAVLKAAAT